MRGKGQLGNREDKGDRKREKEARNRRERKETQT